MVAKGLRETNEKMKKKKTLKQFNMASLDVDGTGESLNKVDNKKNGNSLGRTKKRIREKHNRVDTCKAVQISAEAENVDKVIEIEGKSKKDKSSRKKKRKDDRVEVGTDKIDRQNAEEKGQLTKAGKRKNEDPSSEDKKGKEILERRRQAELDEVYQIPSVDEDCSRGIRKWIMDYNQRNPGLKILQERIDEFITAHEAQEKQARKEKEALAAEGGWTVVVHQKGRKKTTDSESGITVGSVAQAAVVDKMAKNKSKEIGLDFYRFQRREAQRNEVMMLQSEFEQDKKRIQQLRAARKFRPY